MILYTRKADESDAHVENDQGKSEHEAEGKLGLVTREYPPRPPHCTYTSLCQLYQEFSRVFLQAERIDSACGHAIMIFDHHFFHMAGIEVEGRKRLFMAEEKNVILSTTDGFGDFKVLYGGSRARNLSSAYVAIAEPDEVWEENPRCTNARWVYIKQFASMPYAFTVALVTHRPEENLVVPVSSFPCRQSDVKKWRDGKKIY